MRVSTALIHNQGLQNILRQQEDLVRVQNEISEGKKILSPSDDPSGAARVVDIMKHLTKLNSLMRMRVMRHNS